MTHHGSDPVIVNAVFEFMAVTYPYWMHGLNEEQIKAAKRLWAKNLQHVDNTVVRKAIDRCPREFTDKAPTVGQFYHLCKSMEPADRPKRLSYEDDDDRAKAKRACARMFTNRIMRELTEMTPMYSASYQGNFPVSQVVEAVRLPEGHELREHQRCWNKLWESFNAVWNQGSW